MTYSHLYVCIDYYHLCVCQLVLLDHRCHTKTNTTDIDREQSRRSKEQAKQLIQERNVVMQPKGLAINDHSLIDDKLTQLMEDL